MELLILFALVFGVLMSIWDYLWVGMAVCVAIIVMSTIIALIYKYMRTESYLRKKEQRRINKISKEANNDNKKLINVARLGKLGQSLDLINQELEFLKVIHREVVECKTMVEYQNFTPKTYIAARFSEISELVANLHSNAERNSEIYEEYKKKFLACKDFTTEEEIRNIPKRGMSVKKFKELEKKLFNNKIKNPPNCKVAIEITIQTQGTNKLIVIDEVEIKTLLKEIKDEKEYEFVKKNSLLYKFLCILNDKYEFYDIQIGNIDIKCDSYNEYQKFDIRQYARKCLMSETDGLEILYNQTVKNEQLYMEYKKEYLDLAQYLRTEKEILEMDELPLSVVEFQILESQIYSQMLLEPVINFSICYNVEYRSPAGRNYYKKEERLTLKDVRSILHEIEDDEIVRREREKQKDILRAEKAEWLKEKRKEKSLQHRENKLAEKEALLGSIELREKRLQKQEENLLQREKEFFVATRGHIYAVNDSPVSIEVEQPKIERSEKPLSDWEKLKQLKKAYENGEISYEEYNIKRMNLL